MTVKHPLLWLKRVNANCKTNAVLVNDPYVAFAKVAQALDITPAPAAAIADSASISGDATIGQNVSIGANAVIESGVVLN